MNGKWLMVLLTIVSIAYPVIVYFGLQHFSASAVSALLLILLLARLILNKKPGAPWFKTALIVASTLLLASSIFNSQRLMQFYPVVINLAMLSVFALSVLRPPTVIETLARIQEPDLPPKAVAYTTTVTKVWCAFFTINGSIAGYTALYSSMEVWTLYNGFISYVLIGLLFGIEYLVRLKVRAKQKHGAN